MQEHTAPRTGASHRGSWLPAGEYVFATMAVRVGPNVMKHHSCVCYRASGISFSTGIARDTAGPCDPVRHPPLKGFVFQ